MSDEVSVYRAPIPYTLCDALMAETLNMHIGIQVSVKRQPLTTASCVYQIGGQPPVGAIYLRESADGFTLITLYPKETSIAEGQVDNLRWFLPELQGLIDNLERDRDAPFIDTVKRIDDFKSHFAGFYTEKAEPPPRPKPHKKRGPRILPANRWARTQSAQGKTVDDLLSEYMRRRPELSASEARELLRKVVTPPKPKKQKRPE